MPEAVHLYQISKARTPEQIAEAQSQAEDPTFMFWGISGINPLDEPQKAQMVFDVQVYVEKVVLAEKATFNRIRPHKVISAISPVVVVPWHSAYPSGHATQAMVMAHLFSTFTPGKKADYFALARRIGHNREVAGVHYRSDTIAGFSLADQIFKKIAESCSLAR